MREERANADAVVAAVAARQHGVITTEQLTRAGLDKSAVSRRVQTGRLHRIHRGVYAVGHAALGNEGRWLAAVLACGEGAVLSHTSAAEFLGMLEPRPGSVHVTVAGSGGRVRRPRLRVHRSSLKEGEIESRRGIRVTSPARTLVDLRRTAGAVAVRRATRAAEVRGYDLGDTEADRTRSELERMFLRLCRRYGVPLPEVNVTVGGYMVDFLWRAEGLAVEVDGWRYHRGRSAFEADHQRDLDLHRHGLRTLRFTHRQLTGRPAEVASAVLRGLVTSSSR